MIAIDEDEVFLLPFEHVSGMYCGQWLSYQGDEFKIRVGDALLGRLVDGIGRPMESNIAAPIFRLNAACMLNHQILY